MLSFQETPKSSMTHGSELNCVLQEAALSSCIRYTGVVQCVALAGGRGKAHQEARRWGQQQRASVLPHSTWHLIIGGPAPLTPGQRDIGQ